METSPRRQSRRLSLQAEAARTPPRPRSNEPLVEVLFDDVWYQGRFKEEVDAGRKYEFDATSDTPKWSTVVELDELAERVRPLGGTAKTGTAADSHTRTFVKGMSWRVAATMYTIALTFYMYGTIETALKIGPTDFILKYLLYVVHERLYIATGLMAGSAYKVWVKMFTWKAVALSTTIAVTYYNTGDLASSGKLGAYDTTAKIALFWLHEYAWDSISWGLAAVTKKDD